MCRILFGKRNVQQAKGKPFGSFQPVPTPPVIYQQQQPVYHHHHHQQYQPIYQSYYHHYQQQQQQPIQYHSIPTYSNQVVPAPAPVKHYKPIQPKTAAAVVAPKQSIKVQAQPIKVHTFKQPPVVNNKNTTTPRKTTSTKSPPNKISSKPPPKESPKPTLVPASPKNPVPALAPATAPVPAPVSVLKPIQAIPAPAPYVSKLEQSIRTAKRPIQTAATNNALDVIEINGIRGIWLNKEEVENWKGDIPINEYPFNQDAEPEVIKIKQDGCIDMVQNFSIKYLKPPRPLTPGPIIIKQEANIPTAPAPPIIIRQIPDAPCVPPQKIIREKPPNPPEPIATKIVVIPGQRLPPPPRRVIIERLPSMPAQPEAVHVERWLPYDKRERKVILEQKPCDPCMLKQKNAVIEWEAPCVTERIVFKDLGVENADPNVYVEKHGVAALKSGNQLPKFALDAKPPAPLNGIVEVDLTGDLHGLKLFNLEKEGLSQYQKYIR